MSERTCSPRAGTRYLEYAPLVIAICVAIAALGFIATVLAGVRGRDSVAGTRRLALIAALAPVAFVLQELIERYAHDGRMHWELLVSTPFLIGLVTQLPFALLAAAIGYALAITAQRIAAVIVARARRPRQVARVLLLWPPVDPPRRPVLARGYTGRGPPLPA